MRTSYRSRLRRAARYRRHGQSIPIIALMIVILVAMVGLSVDVGNTFSEEREAVSATNAASIAGMTAYLQSKTNPNTRDSDVYKSIEDSLKSNGLRLGDGLNDTVKMDAYYLDSQGNLLSGHPVIDPSGGNAVPGNVAYIQVRVNGKVNTSFARVVGRNDLPISATAHAGLCPANFGIYPLAVDNNIIGDNEFNKSGTNGAPPEWQRLPSDHKYAGYVQRRVYMKNGAAGSFSWLRWMENTGATGSNANSNVELSASMTGYGNVDAGFEEATWPSGFPKPEGYPEEPGTVNKGDWIWGSSGWNNSNALNSALQQHIDNETRMILPIYSDITGNGSGANNGVRVRVVRLGTFIIIGEGRSPGNGPYFDMIFMGDPVRQYTACSVTPPPPANANLELWGKVSFFPEYAINPNTRQPIQYVVVLDGSGSMSANFNGQCNNSGGTKQCANGPPDFPPVQVSGTGLTYYWTTESERRIYVAKKALERLVSLTNMPGTSNYDPNRPSDQMAVVWFREYVKQSQYMGFSTNAGTITNFITNANNQNGNYRSEGGTNGAAGLYQASRLYSGAPKTVPFGGKDWEYKRVVLFITDGVSNQFLNTNASDLSGGSSSSNTYPSGSICRNLGNLVIEDAGCQTTDKGGTYRVNANTTWDRPITQMVSTSTSYLRNQTVNAQVFVIALSNIPSTGLKDGVASSSSYFFSAESLIKNADGTTNVDKVIDEIATKVVQGNCLPGADGANRGTIPSDQFINSAPGVSFSYPQVGEVIITSATDTFTAPVTASTNGELTYRFTNVPRGTYSMRAYLYYHHPLDPPNVMRQYSKIYSGDQAQSNFTVDVVPSSQSTSFNEAVRQDVNLRLNGDVCATS